VRIQWNPVLQSISSTFETEEESADCKKYVLSDVSSPPRVPSLSFFLSLVRNTQANHWTKRTDTDEMDVCCRGGVACNVESHT